MLGMLFSMIHGAIALRVSDWWPRILALPPSNPYRMIFSFYWWPPMQLLGVAAAEAGAPQGGITNMMLLPLGWMTCSVYGFLTGILLCLPFRLKRKR